MEDRVKKSRFLSLLLLILFIVLGIIGFNSNIEAASFNTSDSISVRGAQMRTAGSPGIRFVGSISSTYDTSNVTAYGMAIAFGDVDVEDIYVGNIINDKNILFTQVSQVDESNFYYINLIDIPESMYGQKVSARAYVVENGERIYSSTKTTRSLGQVAITLNNLGQSNALISTVVNTINTKYKQTFVDDLGSVYYTNTVYETNNKKLGKAFINDWNSILGTDIDPETAYV